MDRTGLCVSIYIIQELYGQNRSVCVYIHNTRAIWAGQVCVSIYIIQELYGQDRSVCVYIYNARAIWTGQVCVCLYT